MATVSQFAQSSTTAVINLFSTQRTAFFIIFAVLGTATVIHDPDFYFHLVAGQFILAHQSLPHVDVFSFTMAGQPWHMHEWLFEVLAAALYAAGGEPIIVWSVAGLGIWAVYLVFRAGLGGRERSLLPLVPALVLMVFYLPYVTQRPQVISYLFFAVYLAALFAVKYQGRHQGLRWLPLLMVIWVNSHGGYLLGIAVLGLFTVSEWLLWRLDGKPAEKKAALERLAWTLMLTVIASLANPYFIHHWLFPFELMNMRAMSVISEWQAPDFSDRYIQGYLLCVLLFLGRYLSLRKSPDLTEWLLPFGIIAASLTAVRHVPLALLVMLPFFLKTLERPSRFRLPLGPRKNEGGASDLGTRENIFNMILLLLAGLSLYALSPVLKMGQQQLKQSILPVKAVDFIERNDIGERLFNQYRYGGYLLYRRYPEHRVFIDIRADMYGDAMMRDYSAIYFSISGWEAVFDSYRFDAVLCEQDAPLVKALEERGDFMTIYHDEKNVVLVRKSSSAE